jgi:prepilin-type N-terminal cleavage/methylation domain-containing protein
MSKKDRDGFTLIEMLTVMAIIAILCAALAVAAWKLLEQMAIKTARAEMQAVMAALDQYYEHYGCYPPRDVPSSGRTGMIVRNLVSQYELNITQSSDGYWIDPWQQEFIYKTEDRKPIVRSCGPDQESGTNDDLLER